MRRTVIAPGRRVVRAGVGTAVALGASTAVLLFSVLTLWSAARGGGPAPVRGDAPSRPPAEVDVWVAERGAGVKLVLATEWSDPVWDDRQDASWNRSLGLAQGERLAFYDVVAFNVSDAPTTVTFDAIEVTPPGATAVRSVDLAALLQRAEVASSAAGSTLRALGAGRDQVELPPGRMVRRPVAFAHRLSLADAATVVAGDGTAFRRRRIRRVEWAGLLHSPSVERVRAL